ncbi:MAG: hypothetical protein LBD17_03980 [Endomicrobium sp.]|jgi:hypothetical protein|nr:hypothetical protein [Endomicrobium sp.]
MNKSILNLLAMCFIALSIVTSCVKDENVVSIPIEETSPTSNLEGVKTKSMTNWTTVGGKVGNYATIWKHTNKNIYVAQIDLVHCNIGMVFAGNGSNSSFTSEVFKIKTVADIAASQPSNSFFLMSNSSYFWRDGNLDDRPLTWPLKQGDFETLGENYYQKPTTNVGFAEGKELCALIFKPTYGALAVPFSRTDCNNWSAAKFRGTTKCYVGLYGTGNDATNKRGRTIVALKNKEWHGFYSEMLLLVVGDDTTNGLTETEAKTLLSDFNFTEASDNKIIPFDAGGSSQLYFNGSTKTNVATRRVPAAFIVKDGN